MRKASAFQSFLFLSIIILISFFGCKKETTRTSTTNVPNASPQSLTPKPIKISDHINGYYEYLPEGYTTDAAGTKYPLLIFFHGGSETGQDSGVLSRLLVHGPLKFVKNGTFPASFTINSKTY